MTQLGKYELHETLGRGGFGAVYRATDTALGREVAVKVLHPQLMVDSGFVERFRNEARLVAGLEHPNLVTVYDLGEADGRAFLVMRYLPGGSLRERLQKSGALPFDAALQILRQVSAGLEAAHAKGIIHRDIKPENILFAEDGQAVLSDFGLAKAVLDSTSSNSSSSGGVGTPSYRAPELWRGKPPASPATDQYALACVFTEMLTGERLFAGDTPDEIITKHLVDGPVLPARWPSDAPRGLEKVIAKALEKDPVNRYATLRAFVAALEKIQSPQVAAKDKSVETSFHLPTNLWKLAAIGMFIVSLFTIGGLMLNGMKGASAPTNTSIAVTTIEPTLTITITPTLTSIPSTVTITSTIVPTASAIPAVTLPVNLETAYPSPLQPISIANASRITELAHFNTGAFSDAAYCSGKNWLVVAASNELYFYDTSSLVKVKSLTFGGNVEKVAITSACDTIALALKSSVELIDAESEKTLQSLPQKTGLRNLIFSQNEKTLAMALASQSGQNITLWDVASGKNFKVLAGHEEWPSGIAISPDETILVSSALNHSIKFWNIANGNELTTKYVHNGAVNTVNFSPDGRLVASGGGDGKVILWDAKTMNLLSTLTGHVGQVWNVVFSPDGTIIASAGYDKSVKLWNVATGEILSTLTGYKNEVKKAFFSADGKTIISITRDGEVLIWGSVP